MIMISHSAMQFIILPFSRNPGKSKEKRNKILSKSNNPEWILSNSEVSQFMCYLVNVYNYSKTLLNTAVAHDLK